MDSTKEVGCVPVKPIQLAADGTTKDAGDLTVVPGLKLTGQVVLSDGNAVPAHTQVQISREDAWDSRIVETDSKGNFAATGLPPECLGINLRVPGYTVSPKNASLDRLNGGRLVGFIDRDTRIAIVLDPGSFKQPDANQPLPPGQDWIPRDKRLQGASLAIR